LTGDYKMDSGAARKRSPSYKEEEQSEADSDFCYFSDLDNTCTSIASAETDSQSESEMETSLGSEDGENSLLLDQEEWNQLVDDLFDLPNEKWPMVYEIIERCENRKFPEDLCINRSTLCGTTQLELQSFFNAQNMEEDMRLKSEDEDGEGMMAF
ncbi:hypothetical protein PFISCL1PPCAC_25439, partial [Pristionchus fissidentatus]